MSEEKDKLTLAMVALQSNPDITDEQLAQELGFQRSHSARFWRLRAKELFTDGYVACEHCGELFRVQEEGYYEPQAYAYCSNECCYR